MEVVNNLKSKDTISKYEIPLEDKITRAVYANDLCNIWKQYSMQYKLCPIAGKKGFVCKEADGGSFLTASREVQTSRFIKCINDYFEQGYINGLGYNKEKNQFYLYKIINKDNNTYAKPNIGLITGKGSYCVVDIDNKPFNGTGPTGVQTFTELLCKYNKGYAIDTFTVLTGSNGYHLYFQYD